MSKFDKRIVRTLLGGLIATTLLFGCSSEKPADEPTADVVKIELTGQAADSAEISQMMNEGMTRLHYGDKSGLYELEFDYYTDEVNFDDYLKTGQMKYAEADTLTHLDVLGVELFKPDSALVDLRINFLGPTGKSTSVEETVTVYFHRGRWIRPTISIFDNQYKYDDLIRQAEEAAEMEDD